jgi:hypothetical protein
MWKDEMGIVSNEEVVADFSTICVMRDGGKLGTRAGAGYHIGMSLKERHSADNQKLLWF